MFIKKCAGKIVVLVVYVDDMIVTGNDVDKILNFKSRLAQEFKIKDLGSLRYFLRIEVARSDRCTFISQWKYILDLLEETGMLGCRPINSRIEANHHLSGDMGERTNKERYQRLVGWLIYLAHTRPDVSYVVGVVSQFMHDPRTSHLDAVYRILSISNQLQGKGFCFLITITCSWRYSLMQTGLVLWMIDTLHLATVLFLVETWLLGTVRSNRWLPDLALKLSIELWLMVFVSSCGCKSCCMIWVFRLMVL